MSSPTSPRPAAIAGTKVTAPGLIARKLAGQRITALTAYDHPTATIVDAAGIDVVLVGDSLANTALGYENTLPVSFDEMLVAVRAVRRGLTRALLVADMPFGSYQISDEDGLRHAVAFIKAGAEAVKLEGGRQRAKLVRRMVENGIPVMGHIGLTPQSVHAMGGYKVQGRLEEAARQIVEDAIELEAAGVFSIVLEGMPLDLAQRITGRLEVPTIGIGAGPHCDGQILVFSDLLGWSDARPPRFVRRYANLRELAVDAVRQYRDDIVAGDFPAMAESYGAPRKEQRLPAR